MDPLSDILSLLKPRSYLSAGLDAGGDWALDFPGHDGIKFNAVTQGACWICVDGEPAPQKLEQGDCFLLTQGRAFTLASDPSIVAYAAAPLYALAGDNVAVCNGGGDFFLVGGRFALAGDHAAALLGSLPAIVHVSGRLDEASVLRWSLAQLTTELRDGRLGGFLMAEHLAHIMLVQVLRIYLAERAGAGVGWFFALADPQIGRAIGAMHADPARRWTLQTLAALAGMSRSIFAEKFKQRVGTSPMDYLTRWRMLVAGDRLRNSSEPVGTIAVALGYESESAFGNAFKRNMACSPGQFRRRQALAA